VRKTIIVAHTVEFDGDHCGDCECLLRGYNACGTFRRHLHSRHGLFERCEECIAAVDKAMNEDEEAKP